MCNVQCVCTEHRIHKECSMRITALFHCKYAYISSEKRVLSECTHRHALIVYFPLRNSLRYGKMFELNENALFLEMLRTTSKIDCLRARVSLVRVHLAVLNAK